MADAKISELPAVSAVLGGLTMAMISDTGAVSDTNKGTVTQVAAFLDGLAQTLTNKTIDWTDNTMAFTSAEAITACSDETGSGLLVFATSPTLTTPVLGTPSSGNLSNCTAYPGDSSLVTSGALNSGSITTGFGAIDNGVSNITTGGIVVIDVDGTDINAAGSLTLGAGNDAGVYWDGSALVLDVSSAAAGVNIVGPAGSPGLMTFQTEELTVVADDILGQIDFISPLESDTGAAIKTSASIRAVATNTFSNTIHPTALSFHTSDTGSVKFPEHMRLDAAGRLIIGHNTSITVDSSADSSFQVHGTDASTTTITFSRFSSATASAKFYFAKSQSDTLGTQTILADNDTIGEFQYVGSDGNDFNNDAATLIVKADGTPGNNAMPGEMRFSTNRGGSSSTASMIIRADGDVGIISTNPAAQLEVDQDSTTGAQPVLHLDQADVDEDFIEFRGTSDTSADRALVDAVNFPNIGAVAGYLKIRITDEQSTAPIVDGDFYLAFYAVPTA